MKEEPTNEQEKKEGSVLVPFLVGGLIGAGLALLFAPKSGKELRKDIKDLASATKDKVGAAVDKGRELYEEKSAAVRGAVEAGKMAYIQERDKHRQAG